jgi:hypothetical protein
MGSIKRQRSKATRAAQVSEGQKTARAIGPPQGRDSQVGNPLSGVFLWAQLTVPDHAEFALADGHDLGGAAIVDRP